MLRQKRYAFLLLVMVAALLVTAFKMQTVPGKATSYKSNDQAGNISAPNKVVQSITSLNKITTPKPETAKKVLDGQSSGNKALKDILKENHIDNPASGVKIMIDKSDHTLTLDYNGTSLKSYNVDIGSGGLGDKEIEGDLKTPEGTFYVTNREIMDPEQYYLGSRWLGVSYPNAEDASRGLKKGLIEKPAFDSIVDAARGGENPPQETPLGGHIGIHGGSKTALGSDWTWGCIGLANSDIEEFFDYIGIGTPIIIEK